MCTKLCGITDCDKNNDNTCTVNASFDDLICRNSRFISKRVIIKPYEKHFDITDCIELDINTPSKGAQQKWLTADKKYFIKSCFYYQLRYWNDDLVEIIASMIAQQLGLNSLHEHLGNISGIDCSYTDFWGNKSFIGFGRLNNSDKIYEYSDAKDRIKFTIDETYKQTGVDCTRYLAEMTILDFIVGNEDRHLYNFGVLYDGKSYEIAPIFDSGLGLFEHDIDYFNRDLKDAIRIMSKKPFGSWEASLDYFKDNINEYSMNKIVIPKSLIPNKLGEEYLKYSLSYLGKELELCD